MWPELTSELIIGRRAGTGGISSKAYNIYIMTLPFFDLLSSTEIRQFVCWLLNVPATCECISGTDLRRQFYVLPH